MKKKLLIILPVLVVVIIIAVIVFTSLLKKDYIVVARNADWLNKESAWHDFTPASNSLSLFRTELEQFDKSKSSGTLFDNLFFNKIEMNIELTEQGLILKYIDMQAYKLYAEKDKHILYQILSQGNSEIKLQGSYIETDKHKAQDIIDTSISIYQADLLSKLYLAEDILKSYDGDYVNIVLDKQAYERENCYLISNDIIQQVDNTDFDFQTVCFKCCVYKNGTLQGVVTLFIRS